MAREATRKLPAGTVRKRANTKFTVIGLIRWLGVRGFIALLMLGGIAYLGFLAYTSPALSIEKVTILGAKAVKLEDIELAANVKAKNIFLVNTDQVALAVGNLEQVRKASVSRKWPNEVVIDVAERQPFGIWETKNAKYVADDEGKIIALAGQADGGPIVFDTESPTISVGGRVNVEALRLAQQIDQKFLKETGVKPTRYEHSSNSGLTVLTEKGWRACFGTAENLDYKIATLKAVLSGAEGTKTKVSFIDLRFDMRPYIRTVAGTGR